jgi:cytoskeleton protein RodZ
VGQFGEKLRRERELRGITLEEVAAATKIGVRSLRALEEEKFNLLPGGIFNKGFVRAYARYVGIDDEQAVGDYLAASRESTPPEEPDIAVIVRQSEASHDGGHARKHGATTLVWSLVAIFALTSASVGGWPYLQRWLTHRAEVRRQTAQSASITALEASLPQQVQAASNSQSPPIQPAATETSEKSASPTAPGNPQQASGANQPTMTPGAAAESQHSAAKNISLVVTAKQRSWVSVQVDGKRVMEGTMDPEAADKREWTFHAQDRLVLVTGNPGGIDVVFNGQPLVPLRPSNATRTIIFTPEGMQP